MANLSYLCFTLDGVLINTLFGLLMMNRWNRVHYEWVSWCKNYVYIIAFPAYSSFAWKDVLVEAMLRISLPCQVSFSSFFPVPTFPFLFPLFLWQYHEKHHQCTFSNMQTSHSICNLAGEPLISLLHTSPVMECDKRNWGKNNLCKDKMKN